MPRKSNQNPIGVKASNPSPTQPNPTQSPLSLRSKLDIITVKVKVCVSIHLVDD